MMSPTERTPSNDLSPLRIVLVLSTAYFALNLGELPVLLPFIREELVLTRTQAGLYWTCYFLGATVTAVFTGRFVDKQGVKKSLLSGLGFFGFITLTYVSVRSYGALLLLAVLSGVGMSIFTPAASKGVLVTIPPEKRAAYMEVVLAISSGGSVAGAGLLPILARNFGWRMAAGSAATFALLLTPVLSRLYPEQKRSSTIPDSRESPGKKRVSFRKSIVALLANRQLLRLCAIGLVLGASFGAVVSHLAVFVHEDLHMSPTYAGLALSIFYVGGTIGQPIWGVLSDRSSKGDRQGILLRIGLVVGAVYLLFSLLPKIQASPFAVLVFSLLLGCAAWGWMGVYMIAIGESVGSAQSGTATGLSLTFMRTGILVAPLIFGFIADARGDYTYSWLLLGVAFLLVFCLLSFLHAQERRDHH